MNKTQYKDTETGEIGVVGLNQRNLERVELVFVCANGRYTVQIADFLSIRFVEI